MTRYVVGITPLLACMAASSGTWVPDRLSMQDSLAQAETSWGERAEVTSVALSDIGPCTRQGTLERFAETYLVDGEIRLNVNCRWDRDLLQIVMNHEYGHIVLRSSAHSLDPKSTMFWQVKRGQRVTAEDRARLADKSYRERPTLARVD